MHATAEALHNLAKAYVKKEILSDGLLEAKKHMAGCDECYQSFCTKYVLMRKLGGYGLIPFEMEGSGAEDLEYAEAVAEPETPADTEELADAEGTGVWAAAPGHKVLMVLRKAGEAFGMVRQRNRELAVGWEFTERPQLAMARGSGSGDREKTYVSIQSEESVVLCSQDKVLIQLEEGVFSGEKLKVRVVSNGEEKIYDFSYDEDLGCYEAAVETSGLGEGAVIQVVEG